jgi:hypothetical protein
MLVKLPLTGAGGAALPDPPGGTGSGARAVIIRNKNLAANPDAPATNFKDWTIARDELPEGASRFWVAGGHDAPRYYIYASNPACPSGLYRLQVLPSRTWRCALQGLTEPRVNEHDQTPLFGPVFVNPFVPDRIIGVVATPRPVIKISSDGGKTFCDAPALTALVTASGFYPLGQFDPAAEHNAMGTKYHGVPLNALVDLAFRRNDPDDLVVGSPFTGLFYGRWQSVAGGGCSEPVWRELSSTLPRPMPYVSSLAFAGDGSIYAATEGRGLLRVEFPAAGLAATYFETRSAAPVGGVIAVLHDGRAVPLPWGRVRVTAVDSSRVGRAIESRTDEQGQVLLRGIDPGAYKIVVEFLGDGVNAPSATTFRATVQ